MTDAPRVLVALRVRASPERAFTAFTEQIGRWWQPNGLFRFTDRTPGTMTFEPGPTGRLVETYDDGTEFVVGDVRAWEPPRRIIVGWRQDSFSSDQDTELHVTFDDVSGDRAVSGDGAQTRVTVEHFGWDRIPDEHVARHGFPLTVFQLRYAEWWQQQLSALAAHTHP